MTGTNANAPRATNANTNLSEFGLDQIQKTAMTENLKEVIVVKTDAEKAAEAETAAKAANVAGGDGNNSTEKFKTEEELAIEEADKKAKETEDKKEEQKEVLVVNDVGDVVNEKGEVIRKKGTFEVDEETNEIVYIESVIQPLVDQYKTLGFNFQDETGNDIVFEDTPEGHLEFTQTVAKGLAKSTLDAEFNNLPELKDLYTHLKAGNSALDYYKLKVESPNYENIVYKADDEVLNEKIVFDYLTIVNKNDEATAKEFIQMYKDADKLKEKGKDLLPKLKEWQVNTEAERIEKNKAAIKAKQEKAVQYFTEVSNKIKSGKISYREDAAITIPDTKKAQFLERSTVFNEQGQTQADIAYSKLTLDQRIFIDYIIDTGFKFDDLIRVEAANQNAKKLGRRVTLPIGGEGHKKHIKSVKASNGDFSVGNIT